MSSNEYKVTPVGRLVMGSLTERQKTDHLNQPLSEDKHYFFAGVAIRKDAPGITELLGALFNKANADFSTDQNALAMIAQGLAGPFKFKVDDGDVGKLADKVDSAGVHTCRGCYVLKLSTRLDIKGAQIVNGVTEQCELSQIPRGAFVDVAVSFKGNAQPGANAGIFLSPQTVRLIGHGAPILSGPSLEDQFGASPVPQLPPGASAVPVAAVGMPPAAVGNAAPNPIHAPVTPVAGMPVGDVMGVGTVSPTDVPAHPAILGGGAMPLG